MIIGPKDTIYKHGFYFFEIEYPKDYPFSPPKVTYHTNNHNVRFNPNLYRNGKVCISILNTWHGPQWTSCQTISSILLSLVTLFHNKALTNEPGIKETHRDFKKYNLIIEYSNYRTAINEILSYKICKNYYVRFRDEIKDYISLNNKTIIDDVNKFVKKNKEYENNVIKTGIYSMSCDMKYKLLMNNMKTEIKKIISK